ncbi:MAG: phasin family protein [Rhodospirillales bacterium]|jgi:hypothetical protein|nr:phasin family protein [Rhodospirillales bacterium]
MSEFQDMFSGPGLAAWRGTGLDGVRAMLAMQTAALEAMEPMTSDWLHRREASLAAARHLLDELSEAGDPMQAAQAQQAWWSGASQRLAEDTNAWLRLGAALWRVPAAGVAPEEAEPAPGRPQMRARAAAAA